MILLVAGGSLERMPFTAWTGSQCFTAIVQYDLLQPPLMHLKAADTFAPQITVC